jgi:mucin-2
MPEEHKDIEVTPQQDTAPDTSQQKEKWRAIDWIAGGTFIAEVLWGSWWLITQVCRLIPWNPHVSTEHFAQFYCGVGLGVLSVGYLTLILWPIIFNILKILKMKIFKNLKQGKDSKEDNDPRWFHARILSSGIVGGSYAFLLPAVMGLEEGSINSGGAAALRQAILLATGGLIALIALGETRRKNDNDREAAENLRAHQENMLIQQKEQFEANSFKERKAERRERYTKAIEQLGDEKSSVRIGGVYTLVGLVDEWLEEESIRKYEDRLKEGQVIINNLCAYIRSPFALTSHYDELSKDTPKLEIISTDREQEFYIGKAALNSEADVRLSIIKEIHDRLQGSEENAPGTWSDFEYDFSGSTFFYPVNLTSSYYREPVNFSGSYYYEDAYFSGSIYQSKADFSSSIYEKDVNFSTFDFCSTYKDTANFSSSIYQGKASFENCNYEGSALFKDSIYGDNTTFIGSTYGIKDKSIDNTKEVDFTNSIYKCYVDFSSSKYYFSASFNNSIYCDEVYFNNSKCRQKVYFSGSIYNQKFESCGTTYEDEANFYGSIFCNSIHFSLFFYGDGYENMPSKFTKRSPNFFRELPEPELDELHVTYSPADDPHESFSYATITLFGERNNSFEVSQKEGYSIEKDSNALPIHCYFINSTQKKYIKEGFEDINRLYGDLLKEKNPGKIKSCIWALCYRVKEFHKWRKNNALGKIPYDLDKIFDSVSEISED